MVNSEKSQFGKRVREARLFSNMSQTDLGNCAGVSQSAIFNLETRNSASSKKALELAECLRVSHRWLMTGEGTMDEGDGQLLDGLTDTQREMVQRLVSQFKSDNATLQKHQDKMEAIVNEIKK